MMHPSLRDLDTLAGGRMDEGVARHVAECAACRDEVRRFSAAHRWLAFLPREPVPDRLCNRLASSALAYLRVSRFWRMAMRAAAVGVSVGSALLVLDGGTGLRGPLMSWQVGDSAQVMDQLSAFLAAPGQYVWSAFTGGLSGGWALADGMGDRLAVGLAVVAVSAVVCAAGLIRGVPAPVKHKAA